MVSKRYLITTSLMFSAAMTLASGAALAQETFDWSGIYVGAGAGSSQSTSQGTIVYGSDEVAGWTSPGGYFTGEIYSDVEGTGVYVDGYNGNNDQYGVSLDSLDNWLTSATSTTQGWSGSAFAGAQMQLGSLVFGGEVRASTSTTTSSYSEVWLDGASDDGSAYCNDVDDCSGFVNILLTPGLWSGWDYVDGDFLSEDGSLSIDAGVSQANYIGFDSSIGASASALARVGMAVDRMMIYGVAGPTVAKITANTSAYSREIGYIDVETTESSGDTASYDGGADYYWSGSHAETRVGAEVGIGAEYAVTDTIILRGEATYSNFGSVSVTGYSDDTDATYTVTQDLSRVTAQTGILFKF